MVQLASEAVVKTRLVSPRRTYDRKKAAIGIIEIRGAVAFMVAAKMIAEKFENLAFLTPFLLGSGTGTLVIAGDVEEVQRATNPDWLKQEEVLGKFSGRDAFIASHSFENPSDALWAVMQDLKPRELPIEAEELCEKRLTVGMFETLGMGPFLEALRFMFKGGKIHNIGTMNFGSKRQSVFFWGDQGDVEAAKWGGKEHFRGNEKKRIPTLEVKEDPKTKDPKLIRDLKEGQINGEYYASWFETWDPRFRDLLLLLPWGSNPAPFLEDAALAGEQSYLTIESRGLVNLLIAMDNAAKRGGTAIHSIELGSGREIGVLTGSTGAIKAAANCQAIIDACAQNPNGEKRLINIQVFNRSEDLFGAFMTELTPASPRFDMTGLAVGLVDTVDRGLLYEALHVLREYEDKDNPLRLIGTRKLGSLQAFMAFAGPLGDVQDALGEIKKEAEAKLAAKERKGELLSLGIIERPDEQILRLLPWQAASEYVVTPEAGLVVPAHYYEYDPERPGSQPLAFFETLGLAHQVAIADKVLRDTEVSFVSRYGVGSGLEVFHWAFPEYEKIRRIVTPEFLVEACVGMPNTDTMLLNAAAYPQPGPAMWQVVEHLKPLPAEVREKLEKPKDVSIGVFTARGMHATIFFLDQLKYYNDVRLWGIQKSGGLLMSSVVYGKQADVRAAIEGITAQMLGGIADPKTSSWIVIGNPHPDLVFCLMRSIRMGV